MKTIVRNTLILTLLAPLFYACDDFIEENIEKDTINLLSPRNNLTTIQPTHTFWWDWLDGAETYNMQIVEGTFSSVTTFILDSTITNNKFDVTLYPGNFQWRVRGENNGSETSYTTFNLSIDSTLDISALSVILGSPSDNIITNNDSIDFTWAVLANADVYNIQIHEDVWGVSPFSAPAGTVTTSYSERLPEGVYVWGVQATNNATLSSTGYTNPPRTITIDTTAPSLPTLVLPVNNDTIPQAFYTYQWSQGASTGGGTPTSVTDSIYFYSDTLGTSLIDVISIPSGSTSYSDSLGVDHYWTVRSTDAAGNVGAFAGIRKVYVQ